MANDEVIGIPITYKKKWELVVAIVFSIGLLVIVS
jgi:hypothetical protein